MAAQDIAVTESTQVAGARRAAVRIAVELDFDETAQGQLALVVTEIATNLVKHARGGRVVLSPFREAGETGVDVCGMDSGPGMPNFAECLRDGYSTAGSPGNGLGAIRRLSAETDVFTVPLQGTVIRARCLADTRKSIPLSRFDAGGIVVPFPGCSESGDAWSWRTSPDGLAVLVVDGLGHGPEAADAAQAAVDAFQGKPGLSGGLLLEHMDGALRGTRGAAVAIAEIAPGRGELSFWGVGNIAGVVLDGTSSQRLVSINGIVGNRIGKVRQFTYAWTSNSILVLHTDGVRTKWHLGDYSGLQTKSAAIIAAVLWRDSNRGTDDSTVVAVRERGIGHGP